MSKSNGIEDLRALNFRLENLLRDPHPGLFTWMTTLSDLLIEMAGYAGHGDIKKILDEAKTQQHT